MFFRDKETCVCAKAGTHALITYLGLSAGLQLLPVTAKSPPMTSSRGQLPPWSSPCPKRENIEESQCRVASQMKKSQRLRARLHSSSLRRVLKTTLAGITLSAARLNSASAATLASMGLSSRSARTPSTFQQANQSCVCHCLLSADLFCMHIRFKWLQHF